MSQATQTSAINPTTKPEITIPACEKAADAIMRLEEARAAGEITYFAAHLEAGELTVLLPPDSSKQNDEKIRVISFEWSDIPTCCLPVIPDLCLIGEPVAPAVTEELRRAIQELITGRTTPNRGQALVRPELWAIAYFDKRPEDDSLQIGFRVEAPDLDQATVACQLAASLGLDFDFIIRGQAIELTPNSDPQEICAQIHPVSKLVLPGIMADAASRLEAMAAKIRNWRPGQPFPAEAIIFSSGGDNTPSKSIRFDDARLEVIYSYGRLDDEDGNMDSSETSSGDEEDENTRI